MPASIGWHTDAQARPAEYQRGLRIFTSEQTRPIEADLAAVHLGGRARYTDRDLAACFGYGR